MYCVVKYREAHAFAVVDDKQVVGSRIVGDIVYVHYEEGRYQAVLLYRTVSILEATGRCNELIMNNNVKFLKVQGGHLLRLIGVIA